MEIGRQKFGCKRLGFCQGCKGEYCLQTSQFRVASISPFFCKRLRLSQLMKTPFFAALLFSIAVDMSAQTGNSTNTQGPGSATAQDTPYAIVQRDGNENVWERTTYEQGPDGQIVPSVHRYTETATGLNYKDPNTGEWEASSEVIEQTAGGAVAQHGQHKVIFAGDLATFGAIDMKMPDGQELRSHLLGIGYFDKATGQSVMIAQVTNCIGQLISSNQVWYDGAFDSLKAGVRYTYTREGFEQDIILEEQPPAPEAYGLNSATTVLQALTEFISPPAPVVLTNSVPVAPGVEVQDQTLQFSTMRIGHGRAFLMGNDTEGTAVSKEWLNQNGRQFLVEEVPVQQVAGQLQSLPPAQNVSLKPASNSVVNIVSPRRLLPAAPLARISTNQMKVASLPVKQRGFVLDYTSLNTSQTNYTFQTDTTYFLSGNVNLYGSNTTLEGAAVLKYATNVSLTVNTPVTWLAGAYRPVVMVAKDDNTVGEPVSGSTGNPGVNYYAAKALYFDGTSAHTNLSVENLRILNANAGIVINGQSGHVLNDVQLLKCGNGIAATNTDFGLHNALFGNVLTNFTGSNVTARVEHATSSIATWLNQNIGTNLYLTNCLLVAVTNLGNCSTQNVAVLSVTNGVFQTVGGGSYYLATNSPYRDVGTTNISPYILAALTNKTTYPPIVYQDTNFNAVMTFSPSAQRDTNAPDLGYHYDPMDYAFCGATLNSNSTFTAGTAVGWYATGSDTYGLHLADKQIATFQGTVSTPDYMVRASTVQEGGNGNWANGWNIRGVIGTANQYSYDVTLSPELRLNFTTLSVLSWGEQLFRDWSGYLIVRANNSTLLGGNSGGYIISAYFTNCLILGAEMGQVSGYPGDQWIMRNCTWHEGLLYFQRNYSAIPISVRNCSFDNATINTNGDQFVSNVTNTDFAYNAYTAATSPVGGTNNETSVVFNWQTGPLGSFYLPTNSVLIDAGYLTADQWGLYHFTTQTTQMKEGASIVDVGYHYVALDNLGNPIDTNGDGIPDYLEDANGDGLVDNGETSWILSPYNGLSFANGLQVFTPLK
jgi:hypothetical protein